MTSTNKEVDASSALAYSDDGGAVCYLCLDGGLLEPYCDAIVRAEAQMPDLSTSPALQNMRRPRVIRDGTVGV